MCIDLGFSDRALLIFSYLSLLYTVVSFSIFFSFNYMNICAGSVALNIICTESHKSFGERYVCFFYFQTSFTKHVYIAG